MKKNYQKILTTGHLVNLKPSLAAGHMNTFLKIYAGAPGAGLTKIHNIPRK